MAKRMTDTDKWKKEWFRKLPSKMKAAWEYLRDNCDHAGIWEPDWELFKFQLGDPISETECLNAFGPERFVKLSTGKFFLPTFVEFQYGHLGNSNTHKSVNKILKKHQIEPFRNPSGTLPGRDQDTDTDTDTDTDNQKPKTTSKRKKRSRRDYPDHFEEVYKFYPKLGPGKSEGSVIYEEELKGCDNPEGEREVLLSAIKNYAAQVSRDKIERKYVKNFDTFMRCWRDYIPAKPTHAPVVEEKSWEEVRREMAEKRKRESA